MLLFLFLFFFFPSFMVAGTKSPFSKISVKSQSAVFHKCKDDPSLFCLNYKGDVFVTFADSTTITSQFLEVFVKTKSFKDLDKKSDSQVEKVIFKKNVKINRKNQKVNADRVEIIVPSKLCKLEGNVRVEQSKDKTRDIPIVAECQKANLNWDSDEVVLLGDANKPVSTTIELNGNLKLWDKKKKVNT